MKYRYELNVKYIPACPYGERYLQPILEAKELMSLWLVSVSSYKLTFLLIQRKHNQLKHLLTTRRIYNKRVYQGFQRDSYMLIVVSGNQIVHIMYVMFHLSMVDFNVAESTVRVSPVTFSSNILQ